MNGDRMPWSRDPDWPPGAIGWRKPLREIGHQWAVTFNEAEARAWCSAGHEVETMYPESALIGERWHADEAARQRDVAVARATAAEAEAAGLREVLAQCQSALPMMIAPDAIKQTTVLNAFAAATDADQRARAALSPRMEADNAG